MCLLPGGGWVIGTTAQPWATIRLFGRLAQAGQNRSSIPQRRQGQDHVGERSPPRCAERVCRELVEFFQELALRELIAVPPAGRSCGFLVAHSVCRDERH